MPFFRGIFSLIIFLVLSTGIQSLLGSVRFPARGFSKILSDESAQKRLSNYRSFLLRESNQSQYHDGYSMKFFLRHMPRRGEEIFREGAMYGPYLGSGEFRLHFHKTSPNSDSQFFLFNNGNQPKFWHKENRNVQVRSISLIDSLKPLVEGMNQTAFDLLMPFVFWDGEYENSGKVAGRPAHIFSFQCPSWITEKEPDWQNITLALDDAYDAPLRVEVFGRSQVAERTLILRSFKKLGDRWIVKEIDCRLRRDRSVTRMKITSAALGLDINRSFFLPGSLSQTIEINPELYLSTD